MDTKLYHEVIKFDLLIRSIYSEETHTTKVNTLQNTSQKQINTMATNATKSCGQNTAVDIFLQAAERLEKYPNLKYAANNSRILAEPEKYSAAEIQPCPDIELTMVEREEEPNNIVAWHEMGEQLDREIYYNTLTNEVEDDDEEVIGMRMEPDKEHSDYWIKFN